MYGTPEGSYTDYPPKVENPREPKRWRFFRESTDLATYSFGVAFCPNGDPPSLHIAFWRWIVGIEKV
jgi:hypothetical protein